jgi:acyl-CoA reductase-like NAD-dependent aldehyde dehydrogenase
MAAVAALRVAENEAPAPRRAVDAATAVRRLRDFGALWASRTEAQRAEMLREVYARIEVRGPEFIAAHLTTDAAELGLTVALPETVSVAMASPAGFEPATFRLEGGCSVH